MNTLPKLAIFTCISFISSFAAGQESQNKEDSETKELSIWSSISDGAKSLTDSTLQKADELSEDISNAYDDTIVLSSESINGFMSNLDDSVTLLGTLGFDVTNVYVNVGLIPGVTFTVARVQVLNIEEQNELLKQEEVGVILQYVINKLNQAYDIEISGYYTKDVNIRLTINPGATVHLEKKKSS